MFKSNLIFLFVSFVSFSVISQKEDYNWVLGYDGQSGNVLDTGIIRNFGNTFMYFDGVKMDTFRYWRSLNFSRTNASVSDENGNLLFYTNGIKVFNKMNILMENGDSLNYGKLISIWDPSIFKNGYRLPQGIVIVKNPKLKNLYYLIHSRVGLGDDGSTVFPMDILLTTIDISLNNGLGKVILKNEKILTEMTSQAITLCKHSNGKDWWMLFQKVGENCYYTLLVDSGGIQIKKGTQCYGELLKFGDITHKCFSPNGEKFAIINSLVGVNIFDFSRCDGKISNPIFIDKRQLDTNVNIGIGVSFSPSSRFLYVTQSLKLFQFDLNASNILSSKILIDTFDGFHGPPEDTIFQSGTVFHIPQLAPDGKIYISTGNSTRYLHVINDPDKPGKACNFKQHSFRLPTGSAGIPNFPNFRLGAMKCNSDLVSIAPDKIKLYPNPVTSYLNIDYGAIDWSGERHYHLSIHNALGQEVWTRELPMYSAFQQINFSQYPDGVYVIKMLTESGTIILKEKILKK